VWPPPSRSVASVTPAATYRLAPRPGHKCNEAPPGQWPVPGGAATRKATNAGAGYGSTPGVRTPGKRGRASERGEAPRGVSGVRPPPSRSGRQLTPAASLSVPPPAASARGRRPRGRGPAGR
jgi:hypothetical protein